MAPVACAKVAADVLRSSRAFAPAGAGAWKKPQTGLVLESGAGRVASKSGLMRTLPNLTGGGNVRMLPGTTRRIGSTAGPRAALAERIASPAANEDAGHQLPATDTTAKPKQLSVETLHRAYNAALLSQLAYKSPIEVEYLRLRANNQSKEDVLKTIRKQADNKTPVEVSTPEKVAELEKQTETFTPILSQFSKPSEYFDGKQSLFMKATVAYLFFSPTPKGQANIIWVVFRGTEGHEDMLADSQLWQVEIKPEPLGPKQKLDNPIKDIASIKIHQGFRDQFVAVSTALTRDVENAAREVAESAASVHVPQGPARLTDMFKAKVNAEEKKEANANANDDGGFEVIVAGHSLGAALATIGSFVSAVEHPDVKVSYFGFGSPRVGNSAFAEAYNRVIKGNAIHFANHNDIVTGIPAPLRYRHVGGGIMLDEKDPKMVPIADEKTNLSSSLTWFKNSLEFFGWFNKQRSTIFWSQHDMGLYVSRVKALYEEAKAKAAK